MNDLEKYSIKELEAEIRRRYEPPQMLASEDINISAIRDCVADYINFVKENRRESKDYRQYLFETALITFYGNDIFNWLNEQID